MPTEQKKKPIGTDTNQRVMRQFLSLPIVLGVLLGLTGFTGIYVNHHSSIALFGLNDAALGPTLAFEEIAGNLNSLSKNLLRLNQDGVDPETQAKLLKKSQSTLKKISKQVIAQSENSKGQPYENYLSQWVKDWQDFQKGIDSKLASVTELKPSLGQIDGSISELVEKMGNVSDFIQADVKERLVQSTLFSKTANILLIVTLSLGFLIGAPSSFVIVNCIRKLFLVIAHGK